jgi:hypothetical protein
MPDESRRRSNPQPPDLTADFLAETRHELVAKLAQALGTKGTPCRFIKR